jgi:glycine/D-amino acid oxidase-like deaminating enzyme
VVLVLGSGVNGLSAAVGLASAGASVVVVDKGRLGGGASGIAGGIVRNYYRADAITELVRLSVEMFEEDPQAYGFRQVGYLAAVPAGQVEDLVAIADQHSRVGYESELVVGASECREYLTWSWPDWEAPVEALLHERRGGWADAMQTVRHLASLARAAGVEIRDGVEVVGISDGQVLTNAGPISFDTLVLATGPWGGQLLAGIGVEIELRFLKAQEGEFALAGTGLSGRAGSEAPVIHLDQAGPLLSDRSGEVLVDGPWGIYFRMGRTGTGITGGGLPVYLDSPALDPYGPADNASHAVEPGFEEFLTSGLAATLRRFRGQTGKWRLTAAGGIVSHTADNYPICDWVAEDVYAIVDSGHGFKTLAIGRLVAEEIVSRKPSPLLDPFRADRFERGELLAASKGPYPWT